MSDTPVMPAAPDPRKGYSETFIIHDRPTSKEVIETMAHIAKFLNKMAVALLRDDLGPSIVSAANPASNSILQSSATLEMGAIQFHALIQQQGGLVAPGQPVAGGRPGPERMN